MTGKNRLSGFYPVTQDRSTETILSEARFKFLGRFRKLDPAEEVAAYQVRAEMLSSEAMPCPVLHSPRW